MKHSSSFCRAQQAHHQARAEAAPLENVRRRAATAAEAWSVEAAGAARREARHAQLVRARAAVPAADGYERMDRFDSETPDRGRAAA